MAVQSQQYPGHGGHLPAPDHSNRVLGYEAGHRGLLSAGVPQNRSHNTTTSNAFQVPSSVNGFGCNQYHLLNQLRAGRQGYAIEDKDPAQAMMGNRKRAREQAEELCSPWPGAALVIGGMDSRPHPGAVVNPTGVSTGLRLAVEDDHRLRSASPVSTSGRGSPTWADSFASHLQQERDEVTQLLKLQNEQLSRFIEEKRQRHARQVLAAAEETFQRQMRERDAELEQARRQSQELMERCAVLAAESQHWQSKVRSVEAMAAMLRSNLAQAQASAPPAHTKEGCGDSDAADDCASSYVDDLNDAHTRARIENRELREQRSCRVCRSSDVSMLLLPCRHLCLCPDCEAQLLACPLCRTPKSASVQVFMS